MKCKNRKRCGFYLAFGYCIKAIGETSCGYSKEDIELNRNAMYNKAIDDFVNQFNVIVDEKCGNDTNNYFRKIVKEIAKQLKEVK